ncbi:MAG TPA: GYF domain-containing protein [Chthoniobacteraceae bacterium]|jgi:hypothetical protein|nr:GYF domain-containing protein [Chthoniobacteraceae bacterium]
MEIYLLREQKEVGPYGAEDVRSWLDHGQVSASELAWAPGLESWVPLQTILEPYLAVGSEDRPTAEPPPVAQPAAAAKPILKPLPKATAPQKAFLSYMGVSFAPEITAEEAQHLTEEVSQDPKLAARLARWEEDRLDLHPEFFAEELKERRANRPAYFHKLVQTEGGDCFTGVTKAHCQVLVGFLDVNHPRWDAHLRDAAWHYFFPAIAEKFPQLVHKEWRPKLKYKEGPKVAAELLEPTDPVLTDAERDRRGRTVSRAVAGLVILGLVGSGFAALRSPSVSSSIKAKAASWGVQFMAIVRGDDAAPAKPRPIPKKVATNSTETPDLTLPGSSPSGTDAPKAAGPTDPATETKAPEMKTPETKTADPATAETKPETKPEMKPDGTAPVAQMKPTEGLFDPKANAPAPAVLPGVPGGVAPPRTDARLTRPVQVSSKYGVVTINPGTSLKIVSREGEWITLAYMGQAIRVPLSSTDFVP